MITYWQQIDGQFTKTKKEKLDSSLNTWIDARSVTRDETTELQEDYKIDADHMLDILDPDELSRIEDGDGYILTIVRVPSFDPTAEIPYFTIPVGIIIFKKLIITICWTDSEVIRDFGNNRVKNARLSDFPAFIVNILNRADSSFLRYLKEINRRAIGIQSEMKMEVENREIIQMLGLEKSLAYFSTSLKSNQLLLEKLGKTKLLKFEEDDLDFLEDVKIDNRQAMETADTYTNIFFSTMDAYNSVISNNMNVVMRTLSVINLVMMVPTFITSFFGMNFPLPLENFGRWAVWIITGLCLVAIFISTWLLNRIYNGNVSVETVNKATRGKKRSERKQERKKSFKEKRAIRKEKRELSKQERKIR